VPLPFSLIGLLGLTPFLTGFAFLRNAARAWRAARPGWRRAWAAVGFGAAGGPCTRFRSPPPGPRGSGWRGGSGDSS